MDWTYPVSIKGVILAEDSVLLVENERGEWELPGGRLEPGESVEACLAREIEEELGLFAEAGPILSAEPFEVIPAKHVLVVSHVAILSSGLAGLRVSPEHRQARLVPLSELDGIDLPPVYRRAIRRAVDIRDRIAQN